MTQHSLKNTVVLFTGSDTRSSAATMRRWIEEFGKKHGDENITVFATVMEHSSEILALMLTPSLLGEKRMIVLKDFPKKPPKNAEEAEKYQVFEEKFLSLLPLVQDDVVILLEGYEYDARRKTTKKILQTIDVRTFAQEQYSVEDMVAKYGITMTHSDVLYLKERIGKDPEKIYLEMQKIALFADGGGVTREDIDRLIIPSLEVEVFAIVNYLGADNRKAAKQLQLLLEQGNDPLSIIGTLVWYFERLASMDALLRRGETRERIMEELNMKKTFMYDSTKRTLAMFPFGRIKKAFSLLVEMDRQLKNGEIIFSNDSREEVKLAFIELVLRI